MSESVLTGLCSICHVSSPKYRCPRCQIRTCSLSCIRKHKAWSECSGERDATVYLPRSRLRTAAGVDHDYNFLHRIERAVERSEKVVVEEKKLVEQDELRGPQYQEKWQMGKDGKRRKVLVERSITGATTRGADNARRRGGGRGTESAARRLDKALAGALSRSGTEMVMLAKGMQREKENKTNWSKRAGKVNWQVEWLDMMATEEKRLDGRGSAGAVHDKTTKQQAPRTLSKVMDDVPLWKAYSTMLDTEKAASMTAEERKALKSAQTTAKRVAASSTYPMQDPYTSTWVSVSGGSSVVGDWPSLVEQAKVTEYRFFLARPYQQADQPVAVTRLDQRRCLREVLASTRVLEFPSIYVLKGCQEGLPPGYVLGLKDSTCPVRLGPGSSRNVRGITGSKRKLGDEAARGPEDGELGSHDEGEDDDDETSSSGSSDEGDEVEAEE